MISRHFPWPPGHVDMWSLHVGPAALLVEAGTLALAVYFCPPPNSFDYPTLPYLEVLKASARQCGFIIHTWFVLAGISTCRFKTHE